MDSGKDNSKVGSSSSNQNCDSGGCGCDDSCGRVSNSAGNGMIAVVV